MHIEPFTESAPWERGFAEVFAREIAPLLPKLERERLAILGRRTRRLRIVGAVALAGFGLTAALPIDWDLRLVLAAFVAFGGLAAAILVASLGQDDFAARVKAELMPHLAGFLGLRYDPAADERPDFAPLRELDLLPPYDRASWADGVAGRHRDVEIRACELGLSERRRDTDSDGKSRTRHETVFQGVVATLSTPRPAPGAIVIAQDNGRVLNAVGGLLRSLRGRLARVEIDHPGFEAAFEAYAQDPAAARAWLNGPFLDALVAVAEGAEPDGRRRGLGGAFVGNRFHLAVAGLRLVSVGPVGESLAAIEPHLHRSLAEMSFPLRLVDRFYGDSEPGAGTRRQESTSIRSA
ncbi:DUF3137 domain-containing protein [Salinarimonas rosea]|uniref:DUF3137 domain-containing protein n=1 Tax=Salinarimonas rosea TaxID=552063 RepID=UPI00040BF5AE|nr:DUF3137 domain-containing protein [Salinarimonas rosea]